MPARTPHGLMGRAAGSLFALACGLLAPAAQAVSTVTLHVGDITGESLSVTGAELQLPLAGGPLLLRATHFKFGTWQWRQVELACPRAKVTAGGIVECGEGTLASREGRLPVSFRLDAAARQMALTLSPAETERWRLQAGGGKAGWQGTLAVEQGSLQRVGQLLQWPLAFSRGAATGHIDVNAGEGGRMHVAGQLQLDDLAFNDAAGSRAGEAVVAQAGFSARRQNGRWEWQMQADWKSGEVYWQPWYFASGGHRLQASGWLDDALIGIRQADISLQQVGTARVAATLRRSDRALQTLDVAARDVETAAAYPLLLRPLLERTMLADLEMAGRLDAEAHWREGRLNAFRADLREFDVEDRKGRFALYKVNASVPWALDAPTPAALRYAGGRLLKLPLGAADLAATLNGYSLSAPLLRVPLLDGALTLQDVSAAFLQQKWHWHLGASLSPLSMEEFSHAVGWPTMQGKVAASIPLVTYSNGRLTADGEMGMNVFDGSVVVRNLNLQDPLGLAPRLAADVQMRDLDLDLLTRTFSFGAMTGRLDVDVNGLELSRWQPVHFDAAVRSSPGRYPRKISQRAVENISALGGAGAAAAIQRSFLRFFKEFNYAQIGLSCRLRNGVCQMDGVKPADGGYVIVEGSGVPAITVLGYNRSVSWGELLTRLKRITQSGSAPIIK